MIRVGIVGASGYTGIELIRLLSLHPETEIVAVTSRQYAGKPVAEVFPSLAGKRSLLLEDLAPDEIAARADLIFTAVPHKTAMDIVPKFLAARKKVVDLSADFRIRDVSVYEEWYQPHSAPDILSQAVYGLPEIYGDAIRTTSLVANPGCYPTSAILGVAPLVKSGLVDCETLIIDSKSGTSGAGRAAQTGTLYCEVTDGFRAYKVAEHRHTPEIEQEIGVLCGQRVRLSFTPHLVPMSRGILGTIYAKAVRPMAQDELQELYAKFYKDAPFVRICPNGQFPATQFVRGSNFCDIGFRYDSRTGRIIVLSAIDNLVKGAAGQAVQNMNLMCGLPETLGLQVVPLFP